MKDIYLGKNESGEDILFNFEQEGIRFILLAGATGTGKSIFHNNLYKELSQKHSPAEIGFIFMDMTRVDFTHWNSEYLILPTIVDIEESFDILEKLKDEKRTIFVHIEECNMVYSDREKLEKELDNILKKNKNIYIIYSTSKIDPGYLKDWMEKYINLKVVFNVNKESSEFLLGNDAAFNFKQKGERILAYNNKQIKCIPFSEKEYQELNNFKL